MEGLEGLLAFINEKYRRWDPINVPFISTNGISFWKRWPYWHFWSVYPTLNGSLDWALPPDPQGQAGAPVVKPTLDDADLSGHGWQNTVDTWAVLGSWKIFIVRRVDFSPLCNAVFGPLHQRCLSWLPLRITQGEFLNTKAWTPTPAILIQLVWWEGRGTGIFFGSSVSDANMHPGSGATSLSWNSRLLVWNLPWWW